MRSRRLVFLAAPALTLALMAQAAAPIRAPATTWSRIVTGRLPNGVRFAILPRRSEEPGVGLLMRNEGGFIAERRPGERGLAHLIEHIAFLSPTAGAPDDVRHLVRIGLPLTFPAPNAGSTSWRESNYYLSTKTSAPADLDTLLGLFREVATDLTLRPDTVDVARGEVVREMADKATGNATYARYVAAVAPGSPGDVIEAQNSDDVPTASVATIRALYQRLYHPEAMMIVVVGDVDPAQTRAAIARRFGSWRRLPRSAPAVPYPMFDRSRIRPFSVSAVPNGRQSVLASVVMPNPSVPPTRARQARAMLWDMLAVSAATGRLAAAQPGAPPGKVGSFIEAGQEGHRQIMLWDHYADDRWALAVTGLRRATCALMTTGFTDAEWVAAQRVVVADLEARTAAMAKVPNVELAKDLSHALADGRALIPPDELLRHARAMLPGMDARAGRAWWRQQWGSATEHLRVELSGPAPGVDAAAAVRAAAKAALDRPECRLR